MERMGLNFTVDPSDYEEDMSLDMSPRELAVYLSQGKARDVAKRHKNAIVLGADSFVYLGKDLLGKPHTLERAEEMLKNLSGKSHTFLTGFTIIDTETGREENGYSETTVKFRKLTKDQIKKYAARDDILGKAGAYSLHGLGGIFVEKIEGECSNVTGLPMGALSEKLKSFGVDLLDY